MTSLTFHNLADLRGFSTLGATFGSTSKVVDLPLSDLSQISSSLTLHPLSFQLINSLSRKTPFRDTTNFPIMVLEVITQGFPHISNENYHILLGCELVRSKSLENRFTSPNLEEGKDMQLVRPYLMWCLFNWLIFFLTQTQ
jgi:hypothetical protein